MITSQYILNSMKFAKKKLLLVAAVVRLVALCKMWKKDLAKQISHTVICRQVAHLLTSAFRKFYYTRRLPLTSAVRAQVRTQVRMFVLI